ncbi:MAG: hypothetical protein HY553_23040 [Elusimicrobia bacterium]|nr:hypothetical protein [Elusimicrobiota bacterium]
MRKAIAALAVGLAACSGGGARRPEGAAPGKAPESAAWGGKAPTTPAPMSATPACANAQYGFTCSIPDGYLLTHEGRGPGKVFNFEKQVRGSEDQATLAVRVAPLGKQGTLESFVERRVARDLKKAQGVAKVDKRAVDIGERSGVELTVDREYASGPYRSRIFCFLEGRNVFIIDATAPAGRFDRERGALDAFVESLTFDALQ